MHPAMLAIALAATPATATSDMRIDVGNVEWTNYPALTLRDDALPTAAMVERMEGILRDRECSLQGQSRNRFDVNVPWVIEVEPDGRITRLVIADTGCRPLETLVAQLVLSLSREGEIRPPVSPDGGVYRSSFNFNQQTIRY